jgi:hypothetical protein
MDVFFKAFKDKFRRGGQTKKQFGGSTTIPDPNLKAKKKYVKPVNGEVKGKGKKKTIKKDKGKPIVTKDKGKPITKKYGGSRK